MSVPTFGECMKPLLALIADGEDHDMTIESAPLSSIIIWLLPLSAITA